MQINNDVAEEATARVTVKVKFASWDVSGTSTTCVATTSTETGPSSTNAFLPGDQQIFGEITFTLSGAWE